MEIVRQYFQQPTSYEMFRVFRYGQTNNCQQALLQGLGLKQIDELIRREHPNGTLEDELSNFEPFIKHERLFIAYLQKADKLLQRARPCIDGLSERGIMSYRQLEVATRTPIW